MNEHNENHVITNVLLLLDIFVIIQVEESPIIGIVLLGLTKAVDVDPIIRVLFVLLIITLSEVL